MGLIRHWRLARADGFDDALFLDGDDRVSEGSAWNLALWDGERIVWPDADQLLGITKRLLRDALPRIGVHSVIRPVHRMDLGAFAGAVATWSICPAQPLAAVDDFTFDRTSEAVRLLRAAWETVPWDTI
jgi:branched-subunit amino acid aminotransferase/4-amino-4-deoxychorismate lyase